MNFLKLDSGNLLGSVRSFFTKDYTAVPSIDKHIIIYTGLFSYTKKDKELIKGRQYFNRKKLEDKVVNLIKGQYYPVFRKFILNDCEKHYLELNCCTEFDLKIKLNNGKCIDFKVSEAALSFFNDEIGLGTYNYSIQFDKKIAINDFISCLGLLRNHYSKVFFQNKEILLWKFIQENLLRCEDNPKSGFTIKIDDSSNVRDYNGSKLKAFVAIEMDSDLTEYSVDEALFEMGTLTDYNSSKTKNSMLSPSKSYFENILSKKISVFNNWSALCLFDSFVMVYKKGDLTEESTLKTIKGSYFKIYLFNLYSKFYLFKTNSDLETKGVNINTKQLFSFLQRYDLSHISYNFLPNLLHSRIREALELDSELKSIRSKIDIVKDERERIFASHINYIIIFITCLGIVPFLKDVTDVFNLVFKKNIIGIEKYAGAVVVLIIIYFICIIRKNRMR